MTKKAELHIACSEYALHAAADIAPDYQLGVAEVAELIETLKQVELPDHVGPAFIKHAETLRGILVDLVPPLQRLHAFQYPDVVSVAPRFTPGLTLPMLAMVLDNDKIDWLKDIQNGLLATMDHAWHACPRDAVVLQPRAPLVSAMMATAAQFWFDHGDEFPTGDFADTAEGLRPEQGSGMEFIARVVITASPTVEIEEVCEGVGAMQDAIGMTGYLEDMREEEEEKAAMRAKLRIVK